MNTRQTSDYSPTKFGSAEHNAAIAARREMLKHLAERDVSKKRKHRAYKPKAVEA